MTKPSIDFFERLEEHGGPIDTNTAFALIRVLFDMAPTQLFRDELTAITGTMPNQPADIVHNAIAKNQGIEQ
jgi:hypothetical protein